MAALHCTVASVPAREYVFVSTDANARTEKVDEGGGEADSKVLSAYGRDVLNENGKLLLDFAEDNKLALLNFFFCTSKSGVLYTFESANRSKGHAGLIYILTKQANRQLIRCVNVRRPPLKAPESDRDLVYTNVRIPRRSEPNRRKGDSTKETPKLADLSRLITDQNLRFQDANTMVAALPAIPDSTCISGILPPTWPASCFPLRPSWYRSLGVRADHRIGTWGPVWRLRGTQHGNRERRRGGAYAQTHNSNLRKGRQDDWKKSSEGAQGCRAELLLGFRPQTQNTHSRRRPGRLLQAPYDDEPGHSLAYVKDEKGVLLKDVELIRERWVR